jgi:uncharacterized protein (DUF983 family)
MSGSMQYVRVVQPLPEVRHCPMCDNGKVKDTYLVNPPDCPFCDGTGHIVKWPDVTYTFTTGSTTPAPADREKGSERL